MIVADGSVLGPYKLSKFLLKHGFTVLCGDLLPKLLSQIDCVAPLLNHFSHETINKVLFRSLLHQAILEMVFERIEGLSTQCVPMVSLC